MHNLCGKHPPSAVPRTPAESLCCRQRNPEPFGPQAVLLQAYAPHTRRPDREAAELQQYVLAVVRMSSQRRFSRVCLYPLDVNFQLWLVLKDRTS